MTVVVLALGGLIFLAHLFGIVFQRTRIPDVLLLMAVGLLLGPVTGIVQPRDLGRVGQVLSSVALVVILFEGGTDIDLGTLMRSLRPTLRLPVTTFVATAALFFAVGVLALGLGLLPALLLGCTLGGSSSAVVIPLARGLALTDKAATILTLESALTDVLCIVTVFAMLDGVQRGSVAPFRMLGSIAASMVFAALLGVLGGVAWMRVLELVRRIPNTILATVAFVLIVYGGTELLGFSGGIAALAFGVTLTNHARFTWIERLSKRPGASRLATLTPVERQFFAEMVFLLKTFFFVYLGQSIAFGDAVVILAAVVGTLLVYLARLVIARRLTDRDTPVRDAGFISVLVPKGLAAAVLADLPRQAGIAGGELIRDTTYVVVFFSIVLTAALGWASERPPLKRLYESVFTGFGAQPPAREAVRA
jgi:NhaP-type Na+/H+ or K+/H+ antiporter